MTLRNVGSASAAVLAAVALAGPAGAIPIDEEPVDTSEPALVYEAVESDPGIVCGLESETSFATAATAASLEEASASAWDEGDACSAGVLRPPCKRVTVKVRKPSLFHLSTAFEWVVEKTWCWSYPRITSWAVNTYPTVIDRFMKFRGLVARWDRYYTACCFSSTSGHTTYRMAEFENCLPIKGCIGSWYPRVRINVAAGGAWRYEKDV